MDFSINMDEFIKQTKSQVELKLIEELCKANGSDSDLLVDALRIFVKHDIPVNKAFTIIGELADVLTKYNKENENNDHC